MSAARKNKKVKRKTGCANSANEIRIFEKKLAEKIAAEAEAALNGKEVVRSDEIREAVLGVLRKDSLEDALSSYELSSLRLSDIGIREVIKRNGKRHPFHIDKLFKSIRGACVTCGIARGKLSEDITKKTVQKLSLKAKDGVVTSQEIKDATAAVLKEEGFSAVEKEYLTHRYV